jgi:hypothetical protein
MQQQDPPAQPPAHPCALSRPFSCTHTQGLLKEKLELVKVKAKDGRSRVTLKPIEDQLTFDKV